MVREVKNLSLNFKQIVRQCFILLNILIWIVKLKLHQKLYTDSLHLADITRHFF